jgi:DNA-binding NarL/FixJ family response regulator
VPYQDGIPSFVWSTLGRLLAAEHGEDPGRARRLRIRATDGRWAVVEASRLDDGNRQMVITVRPAEPGQVLDLYCRAAGLTRRERATVDLAVEGLDTRAIAGRLAVSPYTVQEHLQSAFAKIGVHSRFDLTTSIISDSG